jgi:hypothetical protein
LSPVSGGRWNYKVIYTFSGAGDGAAPLGSFVMDAARNLYGAGQGPSGGAFGEFFELSQRVGRMDGSASPLVMDGAGNLYGTALSGGAFRMPSLAERTERFLRD